MRRSALCLIFFSISFLCHAQVKLDSLWGVWQDTNLPDTVRAQAFKDYIAKGYLYRKPDSARILAAELQNFATQVGDTVWIADAKFLKGIAFFVKGDFVQALKIYEECYKSWERVDDKVHLAKAANALAVVNTQLGDYQTAINYYHKALRMREQSGDSSGVSSILMNMGLLYKEQGEYHKAIEIFDKGLLIAENINDSSKIATALQHLGIAYSLNDEYDLATKYFREALKIYQTDNDDKGLASILLNIGGHYAKIGKLDSAQIFTEQSLEIGRRLGSKVAILSSLANLGEIYQLNNQLPKAIKYTEEAHRIATQINALDKIKSTSNMLYLLYKKAGRPKDALEMYELHIASRDSIQSEQNQREIVRQEYKYQYQKQALADSLEFAKKEAIKDVEIEKQQINISRQRIALVSAGGGLLLIILLAFSIYKGKKRSDELLLNILPEETAQELKKKGYADAKQFDQVTVLFTDFKGFTQISERLTPTELVAAIDECFKAFDEIISKYHIEKIKTIGDAYMAAGGLPVPDEVEPQGVVKAALEMRDWMLKYKERKGENGFEIRIGIHTGPVVAGIVGIKKFQYDIWGDTVNTASRMESSGEVGKVNISHSTYELVKDEFKCEPRGKIQAKGKGEIEMYFVEA